MKSLFTLLLILTLHSAFATNYYFSSVSGDDSRTAAQATSSSTPWKSLAKLNSIFSTLQPGDGVFLKRGETFFGSILVKKSGVSGSPITIGAYGTGNKPVITSLVTVSSWVSKGNGIYESSNPLSGTPVKMVLINGVQQELGRYPNSDAPNKGFLTIDSHSGTTSFTDNQLTSTPNWTGAVAVIRTRRWVIDRDSITSHSGTTISYKAATSYAPINGYGYFITNSVKTLDKFGEWYYNPSTKKLSVYFGSNSPSSYSVQVSTADDLIHAEKFSYITLDNLSIKGSNTSSINIRFGSNLAVTNCDINFSAQNAIKTFYHANLKVEGCSINNSNYNGINMGYTGDNSTIRNNKIYNTSIFAGMGGSGDQQGLAIFSYGNNNVIEYNDIRNVGFIGIHFNGSNVTVKNNYIDSFCFVKDDGSAIYSHIGNLTAPTGRKVIGNIITNGVGAPNGAVNTWGTAAEGIYLDNGSTYVEISGNTIAKCSDQGIFIHNSRDIKITNNTIYSASNRFLAMVEQANHPQIRNCTVTGNVLFKSVATTTFFYIKSDGTDQKQFGTYSGNYFASPTDSKLTTVLNAIKLYQSTATIKSYSAAVRFEYNRTQAAKTVALDALYADAKNKSYSGTITLQPFTAVILIKTGASKSVPPAVSITSPVANATFAAPGSVTISANAADSNGTIKKVEFYNADTLIGTDSVSPYTFTWNNVAAGTYTIKAKATDNGSLVTTSSPVTISVSGANVAPSVNITNVATNVSLGLSSTITISAAAADVDGTITKVDFYSADTLIGTVSASPYTFTLNNAKAGIYVITAKATDNKGAVTTSSKVAVTVVVPVVSPRAANNTLATVNAKPLNIKVYPNPAVNKIQIDVDGLQMNNQKANLSITNVSGSSVKTIPVILTGKTIEADVTSLNAGTYIVSIVTDNGILSKKFVKN